MNSHIKKITLLGLICLASTTVSMNAMAWHSDPLGHDRFSEGLLAVEDIEHEVGGGGDAPSHGKWGFKDKTGKLVIPYQYDDARDFSEGLAPVYINQEIGFIDRTGKVVIKPNPEFAGLTHEINRVGFHQGLSVMGMHIASKNKDEDGTFRFGFINKKGEWVIKPKFESAWDFNDHGIAEVKANDVEYLINKSGQAVGSFQGANEKYGYKDIQTGKVVVKPIYDGIGYVFADGLLAVQVGDKWGYVNNKAKVVIKPIYSKASDFSEGLAAVKVDDKWGYIDTKGKFAIKPQFTSEYGLEAFSEGVARIEIDDKTIYIDKTGREVAVDLTSEGILKQYDDSRGFSDGVAIVQKGDDFLVIDKSGNILFKLY
ncbi:MAG: WG repeat-containing protein [Gallionellaceae bacterium]|jgi:hypothetical protein